MEIFETLNSCNSCIYRYINLKLAENFQNGVIHIRDCSLIIVRGGLEVSGGESCILQWSKGVGLALFLEKKGGLSLF